jgi:hypothetical protein
VGRAERTGLTLAFLVLASAGLQTQAPADVRQWAATAELKQSPATRAIPIIVLSAVPTSRGEAHEAGCDGFLSKPCAGSCGWAPISRAIPSQRRSHSTGTSSDGDAERDDCAAFCHAVICGFVEATTATCWHFAS